MNAISKERLLEHKQGLEAQLQEQLASLNAVEGALQFVRQLLEELDRNDMKSDQNGIAERIE